jgi:hypothetical protein
MTTPQAVRNHISHHKVPRTAQHAYFLLVPPIPLMNPSLESLNCGIDISLRHENAMDSLGPLYCKTWAVKGDNLKAALQTIDRHVCMEKRNQTIIIVALLAHVNVGKQKYCWGDKEISILSALRWALSCNSVKSVLLLGCSTALPTRMVPAHDGKAVIAVTRPVSYNHLWLFLQTYLQAFRQYARQYPRNEVTSLSLDALHAACNSELTRNKLCQYP